jgi:hypothetical protein
MAQSDPKVYQHKQNFTRIETNSNGIEKQSTSPRKNLAFALHIKCD